MLNVDGLFVSLFVLICFRLAAFLVFLSRYIRDNSSRYGAISLGWLVYAIGPVFGLAEYTNTGDSNHPIFGYSAAVGTLLLMFGVMLYHFKFYFQWFVSLFLLFVVGFGLLLVFYPQMGGVFGVAAQLLLIFSTLTIVVFKRKWVISISGKTGYSWLSLFLVLSLLHAFGFVFLYSEVPISLRFVMTFLINLFLYIFLLDFDWGQSFRKLRVSEAALSSSLKEKETLLQEIHHRVKNNMQIIASLLSLQLNRTEKKDVDSILKENMGRVYAMAGIHESLYQSERLTDIDFRAYLQQLTQMLSQTYSTDSGKVAFQIDCPGLTLKIDKANPIGLVLNELISNSLKYAFPDQTKGTVTIKSRFQEGDIVELIIADDGVGLPDGFDWKTASTLGLRIVKDIVERQLDGSIVCESQNGTVFIIRIKLEANTQE